MKGASGRSMKETVLTSAVGVRGPSTLIERVAWAKPAVPERMDIQSTVILLRVASWLFSLTGVDIAGEPWKAIFEKLLEDGGGPTVR